MKEHSRRSAGQGETSAGGSRRREKAGRVRRAGGSEACWGRDALVSGGESAAGGGRSDWGPISPLLTAAEVAAILRVRRSRVYDLARHGQLPVVRLGRQVRFRLEDISRIGRCDM